jgi:hypothetical protein
MVVCARIPCGRCTPLQVFSLISFIYAVVYLVRLNTLKSTVASNPMRLDSESLLKWRNLRYKQYLWMMFSGFGVVIFNIAASVILMLLEPDPFWRSRDVTAQIVVIVVGLAIISGGWLLSRKARGEADELELKPMREAMKF